LSFLEKVCFICALSSKSTNAGRFLLDRLFIYSSACGASGTDTALLRDANQTDQFKIEHGISELRQVYAAPLFG
jgi:hypothetical protein